MILRFAISLRFIMLVASLGTALGALVMFWVGGMKIVGAALSVGDKQDAKGLIASVMGGTDAFLFGLVLIIFAYAIAFAFVFDQFDEVQESLPTWMRARSVRELKGTLIAAVLVYLAVDFATDLSEVDAVSWQMLIKPLSIFLIAGALRLFDDK